MPRLSIGRTAPSFVVFGISTWGSPIAVSHLVLLFCWLKVDLISNMEKVKLAFILQSRLSAFIVHVECFKDFYDLRCFRYFTNNMCSGNG